MLTRNRAHMGNAMRDVARTLTKIVATVGPATQSPEMLRALIGAGVDVLRLNFSHGTHEDHAAVITAARSIAADLNRPIALLQDLQGPKLRVGDLAGGGPIRLEPGATVRIGTTGPDTKPGTAAEISTTYPYLAEDLRVGDKILLDDGALELRVESTEPAGFRNRIRDVPGRVRRAAAGAQRRQPAGHRASCTGSHRKG